MDHLTVYKSPYNKKRIGKNNDGGYIICEIDNNYDIFLSGGIEKDISFEIDLLKKYPELKCVAYDGTINELPINNKTRKYNKNKKRNITNIKNITANDVTSRISFIKKNLGKINNDKISNLAKYFNRYNNIFMKLDIEGGENDLFESLSDEDLTKIKQLVIEFHSPNQIIIPTRLAKTHWLVHFHGNNYQNVTNINNINVPNVFECTYVRKDDKNSNQQLEYNIDVIPNDSLDMPNNPNEPDIKIDYPPFVNKIK